MKLTTSIFALLFALAAPSSAQTAGDDGDWTPFEAPPAPNPVETPTTPEGGFSNPEREKLDGWLHSQVLERVCKALKLKKSFNLAPGDFSGTGVDVARYLANRADGRLALVEEQKLRAAWGHSFSKADGEGGSAGLWLSGSVSGASYVVRPLKSKDPCEEIRAMADLRDIKTVLPFTAKRLAAMQVGELWRVPFTLSYTQAPSLSEALDGRGAASISFGRTHAAAASMTVFRLADDRMRFRLRVDRVVIKSVSAGASVTIPAVAFAADAHNILLRFMEKEVARQFSRRTTAWMSLSASSSDGNRLMLEFIVDPRDPAQAEALAQALKGDVMELVKGAIHMTTLQVNKETTLETYDRIRRDNAKGMGEPTYAAINEYDAKTRAFSANVPFIVAFQVSSLFGRDKITPTAGASTEFRYYRGSQGRAGQYFDVPFLGAWVKDGVNRGAEAVTAGSPGAPHGEPILVYSQNQDFLRIPGGAVRGTVGEMNQVLALAGAQRADAPSRKLVLPVDAIVPPTPPGHAATEHAPEWSDRKGVLSLTLVFNQKAVREAAAAPSGRLLQAVDLAADAASRSLTGWLSQNGRIEDGKVLYDEASARRVFGDHPTRDMMGELAALSRQTANLLADLAAVNTAPTNEARGDALARLVAGKGKSGLSYDEAVKILIQFVDPLDLTGDFVGIVHGTDKDVKNADSHLVLKKERAEVATLREAGQTKGRFAEPSIMTD